MPWAGEPWNSALSMPSGSSTTSRPVPEVRAGAARDEVGGHLDAPVGVDPPLAARRRDRRTLVEGEAGQCASRCRAVRPLRSGVVVQRDVTTVHGHQRGGGDQLGDGGPLEGRAVGCHRWRRRRRGPPITATSKSGHELRGRCPCLQRATGIHGAPPRCPDPTVGTQQRGPNGGDPTAGPNSGSPPPGGPAAYAERSCGSGTFLRAVYNQPERSAYALGEADQDCARNWEPDRGTCRDCGRVGKVGDLQGGERVDPSAHEPACGDEVEELTRLVNHARGAAVRPVASHWSCNPSAAATMMRASCSEGASCRTRPAALPSSSTRTIPATAVSQCSRIHAWAGWSASRAATDIPRRRGPRGRGGSRCAPPARTRASVNCRGVGALRGSASRMAGPVAGRRSSPAASRLLAPVAARRNPRRSTGPGLAPVAALVPSPHRDGAAPPRTAPPWTRSGGARWPW